MKKLSLFLIIGLTFTVVSANASSPRSQSINGATGIITTPTAHTSWDKEDFAIDIGYSFLNGEYYNSKVDTNIAKATIQFLKNFEAGFMYDMQHKINDENNADLLFHGKFKFHDKKSEALAIGGNLQFLQTPNRYQGNSWRAGQIYLVTSYFIDFFGTPSETSLTVGKSFGSDDYAKNDIDFSMGLDITLFPNTFKGYLHWISDFANYSYSADPIGANPARGIFNTGFRIPALKDNKRFKLDIDVILVDVLDSNRDFGLNVCFGAKF